MVFRPVRIYIPPDNGTRNRGGRYTGQRLLDHPRFVHAALGLHTRSPFSTLNKPLCHLYHYDEQCCMHGRYMQRREQLRWREGLTASRLPNIAWGGIVRHLRA